MPERLGPVVGRRAAGARVLLPPPPARVSSVQGRGCPRLRSLREPSRSAAERAGLGSGGQTGTPGRGCGPRHGDLPSCGQTRGEEAAG